MNAPARDKIDHAHSLASILNNASLALHGLHELVLDVELRILETTKNDRSMQADPSYLQSLDMLAQSTEEIGLMLARLTDVVPDQATVSSSKIIDPIRLEHLRDLIANGDQHRNQTRGAPSDISLF